MIGMAVLVLAPIALVVVSIVAPQWLGVPRQGGEGRAASVLVSLANAQELFKKRDLDENGAKDYWVGDLSGLYRIEVRGKKIDLANFLILHADAKPLPAGKESGGAELSRAITDRPSSYYGYFFAVIPRYEDDGFARAYHEGSNRHPNRFGICAFPERDGPTLIISERREVWLKDTSGRPVDVYPAHPGDHGWKRIR
jgi:hypothetical protein